MAEYNQHTQVRILQRALRLEDVCVDGGLRDFLRGQAIFLSIQSQDSWTTEIQRWTFLLSSGPMGNYAKRAAVLMCVVALVWFGVLALHLLLMLTFVGGDAFHLDTTFRILFRTGAAPLNYYQYSNPELDKLADLLGNSGIMPSRAIANRMRVWP